MKRSARSRMLKLLTQKRRWRGKFVSDHLRRMKDKRPRLNPPAIKHPATIKPDLNKFLAFSCREMTAQ